MGQANRLAGGRPLIATIIMLVLPAMSPFGFSGHLNWELAWVYIGLTTIFCLGSRLIVLWETPDLTVERGQALGKGDIEPWD
jgi:hypothetical protein